MEGLDALNGTSNLYFTAASQAANAQASQAHKSQKKEGVKKSAFSSVMEQAQAESALVQEGLPAEIAGMSIEEAFIFLKDEADIAADQLRQKQMPENFAIYRKKVAHFLRFLEKNNFEVEKHLRPNLRRRKTGKPMDPRIQVQIINNDLDFIARQMLFDQKDTIKMLTKVNEIQGLLVDLMAN